MCSHLKNRTPDGAQRSGEVGHGCAQFVGLAGAQCCQGQRRELRWHRVGIAATYAAQRIRRRDGHARGGAQRCTEQLPVLGRRGGAVCRQSTCQLRNRRAQKRPQSCERGLARVLRRNVFAARRARLWHRGAPADRRQRRGRQRGGPQRGTAPWRRGGEATKRRERGWGDRIRVVQIQEGERHVDEGLCGLRPRRSLARGRRHHRADHFPGLRCPKRCGKHLQHRSESIERTRKGLGNLRHGRIVWCRMHDGLELTADRLTARRQEGKRSLRSLVTGKSAGKVGRRDREQTHRTEAARTSRSALWCAHKCGTGWSRDDLSESAERRDALLAKHPKARRGRRTDLARRRGGGQRRVWRLEERKQHGQAGYKRLRPVGREPGGVRTDEASGGHAKRRPRKQRRSAVSKRDTNELPQGRGVGSAGLHGCVHGRIVHGGCRCRSPRPEPPRHNGSGPQRRLEQLSAAGSAARACRGARQRREVAARQHSGAILERFCERAVAQACPLLVVALGCKVLVGWHGGRDHHGLEQSGKQWLFGPFGAFAQGNCDRKEEKDVEEELGLRDEHTIEETKRRTSHLPTIFRNAPVLSERKYSSEGSTTSALGQRTHSSIVAAIP